MALILGLLPALCGAADLPGDAARDDLLRPPERPANIAAMPAPLTSGAPMRPVARDDYLPRVRWAEEDEDHRALWTRAALAAVQANATLEDTIPRDIEAWCPAYARNSAEDRRAFWVGLISALSYHESTWRPEVVGGGGRWYGLMQITPSTARAYDCRATTGDALRDAEDNLSCAIRIMSATVPRDNAIALHDGRWRGIAADWGPMTSRSKRTEMSAWTREQDYCALDIAPLAALRPEARPVAVLSTMSAQ